LLRDRVLHEILAALLADNVKARFLQKDGRYLRSWQSPKGRSKRPPRGTAAFSAQDFFIGLAEGSTTPEDIPVVGNVCSPILASSAPSYLHDHSFWPCDLTQG